MKPRRSRVPWLGRGVLWIAVASACESGPVSLTPRVASVTIGNVPATLDVGESVRLSATVASAAGETLEGSPVYWGAVDTTIVKVDSLTGEAHARSPGTTRVVASSEDRYGDTVIVVPEGKRVDYDTVVQDELSVTDDADEFTFEAAAGQEINVFLRGTSAVAAHRFRLRLMGAGRNVIDTVSSGGTDPELRRQAIKWLKLAQAGRYHVRVDGNLGADRGSYQLMVQRINPAPEAAAAGIRLGTTVSGESLTPGDADTFTLPITSGQEYSILFRALSQSPADALRLRLLTPAGGEQVFVQSNGDYPTSQASGRQLLQPGQYTVRVQGVDAEDQGPYELQVLPISRSPERVGAAVAAGTVVGGEDIAPPGDVDEFTFTAAAPQEVNVYFRGVRGAPADSLRLRVLNATMNGLDSVAVLGTDTILFSRAIGHLKLGAGGYRIQVEGGRNTHLGYGFLVRAINLAPEGVGAVVSVGATASETISPVGDVDQFRFRGNAGDAIRIGFRATSGAPADVLRLYLFLPNGAEQFFIQTTGSQAEQTASLTLPQTGDYTVRVQGLNSTDDAGPYRFQVVKVN